MTACSHGSRLFQKPGSPNEEQDQSVERESEEGAGVTPSSPEEWPESPTEEGHSLSPGESEPRSPGAQGLLQRRPPRGGQGARRRHWWPHFPPSCSFPPDGVGPDTVASGETSPSAR